MEITNEQRAQWARGALESFDGYDPEDLESSITDLVCDLRHLADRREINWAALIDRVTRHYEAETRENE